MGERAGVMANAITWSGTFHAVGARLLREYAERVGLDRNFSIHDREDSADLLNLIRPVRRRHGGDRGRCWLSGAAIPLVVFLAGSPGTDPHTISRRGRRFGPT